MFSMIGNIIISLRVVAQQIDGLRGALPTCRDASTPVPGPQPEATPRIGQGLLPFGDGGVTAIFDRTAQMLSIIP